MAWWREHDVFGASIGRRQGAPEWTFYEGPPTANGRPGSHHVEARTFKDVFPRYRTMKGHQVARKAGWDCHGLPVELEVEKELGLTSKADIETFGIEAFNQRCRESVTRYVDDWRDLTDRIGFWVDMDDAYWTMDARYIDSVWWALKSLWDRGLIFEDFRVTPYCARCGTALSDAEVALGYQTVDDPSVYVRFPILDGPLAERGAALLVWTTTPWTLPANVAVAVGADIGYELVDHDGQLLVVAADRRVDALGPDAVMVDTLTATDLIGLHYQPPFDFVATGGAAAADKPAPDRSYVIAADFVTTSDGSGSVHIAPAFGADDLEVARQHRLPVLNPVDRAGKFTQGPWAGQFVKDADTAIVDALDAAGLLVRSALYEHSYPFCWRCKTPLIYYAKPSWYIRTTAQRAELLANNATIDWHPDHIRDGRFGNWLENNVDWALSRDRYWGTPLPFWRCDSCAEVTVAGSRAELGKLAGRDLATLDPHRPYVDSVVITCPACGGEARRVPEVADTWFDSGAMPYAQWGYPYDGTEQFTRSFPADFICEAIDQTRGWFYTLLAESTLLFDVSPYKTVLCLGHIVDEAGKKMSKSLGNIIDPWELIDEHGADALRWLMLAEGNPWGSRRVGSRLVEDVVRRFLLTVWNMHHFFCAYAKVDGFDSREPAPAAGERPATDRWALAELANTIAVVDGALADYDVSTACRRLERFVDDLSNWYVRRNRRRYWRAVDDDPADKAAAYHTLHTCLKTLAQLLAPFTPFVSERLWLDLTAFGVTASGESDGSTAASVHLTDFPEPQPEWVDDGLRATVATLRRVVELGRQARNESGIKVRQPLARAVVSIPEADRSAVSDLLDEIADELNLREVELHEATSERLVDRVLRPNFRALGPAFGELAPRVADALRTAPPDQIDRLVTELETGTASMLVGNRTVEVTPDMVDVHETPRVGWHVASDSDVSIAIDTAVDFDLKVEGAARDVIRALNQQRKALDLALDARVDVVIDAPQEVDHALGEAGWYDTIAREVLARSIHRRPAALDEAIPVEVGDLGQIRVQITS